MLAPHSTGASALCFGSASGSSSQGHTTVDRPPIRSKLSYSVTSLASPSRLRLAK